ncbi:hypothetical protein C0Q70_18658 [Pomacea canaliculata]|uniref:Calcineurin-like phosphoesterase domain-containing protein n=1 Tax=Pomacea canaliculata TaxID=400727 RepID=A0A2T7NH87_POMCA|nr:hypothetical protein C0Q70_18658 [Pomacea canaliculata]
MQRAFQTSMFLHQPDIVFVLGDLLDEGKWCDDEEFLNHVERFNTMFSVPSGTQRHVVVGNHDVGFHYMMTAHKSQRFTEAFQSPTVGMLHINGVTFVFINSMAMEGDGCSLCAEASQSLNLISQQLKCAKEGFKAKGCDKYEPFQYSRPILLQHFPLFRQSDANCSTEDAAPAQEKTVAFKSKHDTLSQQATAQLCGEKAKERWAALSSRSIG